MNQDQVSTRSPYVEAEDRLRESLTMLEEASDLLLKRLEPIMVVRPEVEKGPPKDTPACSNLIATINGSTERVRRIDMKLRRVLTDIEL